MSSLLNMSAVLRDMDTMDRRRAGMFYALAVIAAKSGYKRAAKGFGEECILLLTKIGTNSFEECATVDALVEDVVMPDFLHENIVRERLSLFGVELSEMNGLSTTPKGE